MFDSNGNLQKGMHHWGINEVEQNLVNGFPTSKVRSRIFLGYLKLRRDLEALDLHGDQWLDGSFTTSKIDPGDIDLVNIIDKDLVDALPIDKQIALSALIAGPDTKKTHECDSYFVANVPVGHPQYHDVEKVRAYWLKWFGTDRKGNCKGLVATKFSALRTVSGHA